MSVSRPFHLGWSNSLEKVLPRSYVEGEALTASFLVAREKGWRGSQHPAAISGPWFPPV